MSWLKDAVNDRKAVEQRMRQYVSQIDEMVTRNMADLARVTWGQPRHVPHAIMCGMYRFSWRSDHPNWDQRSYTSSYYVMYLDFDETGNPLCFTIGEKRMKATIPAEEMNEERLRAALSEYYKAGNEVLYDANRSPYSGERRPL
jgi:hypothetical protein